MMVRVADVDLYVVDRGSGHPVLLVHGFPLDHSMWDGTIERLARQDGYRVIAPDLRGFGRSSGPNQSKLTMAQLADDLAELLDALKVRQPVTFCGLSMGGYIAWQFWKRHPNRLERLVLCDTRAAADSPEAAQVRLQTAEEVLEQGTAHIAASMVPRLFSERTRREKPQLVEKIQNAMVSTRPETMAAALRGLAEREDFTEYLGRIDVPSLVVCGQYDAISPVDEMRGIAEAMPRARFRVIEGAGHMAPAEDPETFCRVLEEFLATADQRPPPSN
ncbi:MAG: alpha/beta hydrolase [Pirellulaceae bacterium]|nr:MAG: alpha/beta hydrolase [Pirellulaceae bacterium]